MNSAESAGRRQRIPQIHDPFSSSKTQESTRDITMNKAARGATVEVSAPHIGEYRPFEKIQEAYVRAY
jgi:hypothetical protein